MPKHKPRHVLTKRLHVSLCIIVLSLAFFMVVPVWVALSAGIASLSLELFIAAVAVLLVCYASSSVGTRSWLRIALGVALLGAIVPQLAFMKIAQREGTNLSFDPLLYVTFSGASDIAPTKVFTYKTLNNQKLDISYYKSAVAGDRPAVVLLHGGGWRFGDHLEVGQWPRFLTSAGFTVYSIEYRLSTDTYHSWRETPLDVHDAVLYIKRNAASLSTDPNSLTLLGQSAGGHLALLEAYRHHDVSAVIALYAPIDLALDYQTSRDKASELDFLGGPPRQFPERYKAVSPIQYVSGSVPRTLIVQGSQDDLVDVKNARLLASTLDSYNVDNHLLLLPMTGHSFENQRGGFATQITSKSVLNFLSR